MNSYLSRRTFLASSSAAAALFSSPLHGLRSLLAPPSSVPTSAVGDKALAKVQPFPMAQVRLRDGLLNSAMEINRRYLHSIPNDRLMHTFHLTAGLPTTAEPLGGWEAIDCELRGHFAGGHYLTASALTYASTGDAELKNKADALVSELAK